MLCGEWSKILSMAPWLVRGNSPPSSWVDCPASTHVTYLSLDVMLNCLAGALCSMSALLVYLDLFCVVP